MTQSLSLHTQEIVLHTQEIVGDFTAYQLECRLALDRGRSRFAKIEAATRKAITESRELMAEADAVIARR
jgi:hypothetical protein